MMHKAVQLPEVRYADIAALAAAQRKPGARQQRAAAAQIAREAWGARGAGALVIRGVHGLQEQRAALLPLAPRLSLLSAGRQARVRVAEAGGGYGVDAAPQW